MQFPLGLKPELRSNFDYVFLLNEDFLSNQKRLYEHYAGMFPSFNIFRNVFLEVTDNFGVMVIDNKSRSKNLTDKVFWYRANDPGSYMIGGNKLHRFQKKYFNPDWGNQSKPFDVCAYLKKKNKGFEVEVELEDEENK